VRARRTASDTISIAITVSGIASAMRSAEVAPADVESSVAAQLREAFAEIEPPPAVAPAVPPIPVAPIEPPPPAATAAPAPVVPIEASPEALPEGVSLDAALGVISSFGGSFPFGKYNGGLGLGLGWTSAWFGVHGFVHYSSLSISETSGDFGEVSSKAGSLILGGIEARGRVGGRSLWGWAAGGIGTGSGDVDAEIEHTDVTYEIDLGWGAHLGFGAEARLGEAIGLGVEARWFLFPLDDLCAKGDFYYGYGGDGACLSDSDGTFEFPDFVFFGVFAELFPQSAR
jgi:hypothetical protein